MNASEGDPLDVDHTNNQGADVVIECVGNERSPETAFNVARTGGRISLLGVLVDEAWPMSAGEVFLKGLSVHAVIGNPFAHRAGLLRLIEARRIDPARIVSHTMSLDEAPKAYEMFEAKQATKVVLKP